MKISLHKSNIRTIQQQDPDWLIKDGLVMTPRAAFQINSKCPEGYRQVITECINNGWLKPVAHVRDNELMWDRLSE